MPKDVFFGDKKKAGFSTCPSTLYFRVYLD
jgi:hypothetical protein